MRTQYTLWKASNGWILVPESTDGVLDQRKVSECIVFKNLKEFADFTPKRNRKAKTTTKPWKPGEPDPLTQKV